MTTQHIINGLPVSFDARQFGDVCYVWAFTLVGSEWVQLGDPWLYRPSVDALIERIESLLSSL